MKRREKLGIIAEREATKCFHGKVMTAESNLHPITELYEPWSVDSLDNVWCAAFVYYCCLKAGFNLPVKYPDERVSFNFAGCGGWLDWASLPEVNFFYSREDLNFTPERGDLVIYDYVFCDKEHDHIGIVIENYNNSIRVAEGNINNVSGVMIREKNNHIRGYIRIPEEYMYVSEDKSN
ncbi:MAG: CHAP domain-containing protein [Firmicutes bacterium]|nr:CHAP domain-containing protein [Bacillota bacterium]